MSQIVKLATSQGNNLFVEIDEGRAQGTERIAANAGSVALAKLSGNFEDALKNIQQVAADLSKMISGIESAPDSASLEFGVKLTGGAGIVIASGTAEANIKVTLDWGQTRQKRR